MTHRLSIKFAQRLQNFGLLLFISFDDGNGRLSRIIAERCLAQADQTHLSLYSISTEIEQCKSDYYDILERCQTSDLDITDWVIWFLQRVSDATAARDLKELVEAKALTPTGKGRSVKYFLNLEILD